MDLSRLDLSGKTVLEIGSGRGDTTRLLVRRLEGQRDAQLIVTDISDKFFQSLREEFATRRVPIRLIRTDACELTGVSAESVDYVVCNYVLCAVNAQPGKLRCALERMRQVLQSGGQLFIEEEFPINIAHNPVQQVWADKWRILKSATFLAGRLPYDEIDPTSLQDLCHAVGFRDIRYTTHAELYSHVDTLGFFVQRLNGLLPDLPNDDLRAGFSALAAQLRDRFKQVGGMEVPYYRLTATR